MFSFAASSLAVEISKSRVLGSGAYRVKGLGQAPSLRVYIRHLKPIDIGLNNQNWFRGIHDVA